MSGFKERRRLDAAVALPIDGKTYLCGPLGADEGPAAQMMVDTMIGALVAAGEDKDAEIPELDQELLDDLAERDFYERVIGADTYEQMRLDGVAWDDVKKAAVTVMFDGCIGREMAERVWNADPGKAEPPNRETRRAVKKAATKKATMRTRAGTGRAAPRASTAGTTSARTSAASRPRGRGSSTAGTS